MKDDGTPFFATEYLIREELRMTDAEIKSNQTWFDQQIDEEAEAAAGPGSPGMPAPGGGGAPAAPAAEAPAAGGEVIEGGESKGEGSL